MPRKPTGGRKVRGGRETAYAKGQTYNLLLRFTEEERARIGAAAGFAALPKADWARAAILAAAEKVIAKEA